MHGIVNESLCGVRNWDVEVMQQQRWQKKQHREDCLYVWTLRIHCFARGARLGQLRYTTPAYFITFTLDLHIPGTPLMILVLISILIVLQEHLNLVIHLRPNIIAEAACNDSQDAKAQRTQRRGAQSNNIGLLKRCASG